MELNNLHQEAQKLRMTPAEKSAMKMRVFGVPAASSAPSPYFFFNYQFINARVLAPLAVLIVVFAGAGTAAAAEGSLPGDLLYPVKVSVNETVEIALATTPVARAEVSQKLAERRVEEAEVLAVRGELTAQTGQALAANFEEHAQSAQALADEVETRDPATARELRTKLDSSLAAHGAILATLAGGSTQNQEGADAVAVSVLARTEPESGAAKAAPANQATAMSITADSAIKSDTGSGTLGAEEAAALQARAAAALADAHVLFDAQKGTLGADAVTRVSGEFVDIENLMDEASTTLSEGHYPRAIERFTEVIRKSIKLGVLLKAQSKFERNIITPVFEQKLIREDGEGGPGHTMEASVIRSPEL
jgi:hypothetical protein